MSRPTLVLLYAPDPAASPGSPAIALTEGAVVIVGRSEDADLVIRDPRVSRRHAKVLWDGRKVRVEDVSENGISVDGARFTSGEVVDGDVLRFGDAFVLLRFEPQTPSVDVPMDEINGMSPAMRRVRIAVARAAKGAGPLRIGGPPGVGKRAVARVIHQRSGRPGELVVVDAAAGEDVAALVRGAGGGSVYVSNVASLSQALVEVLGRASSARLMIGTRAQLPGTAGLFEDVILLPPIRRRREDILPYVLRIIGRPLVDLGPELVAGLLRHLWPYNVRELSKVAHALAERGAGQRKLSLELIEDGLAFIGGTADQTLPATSIRLDE